MEKLRLVCWKNDGFPPINLSDSVKDVIKLINEIEKLRRELDDVRKLNKSYIESISEKNSKIGRLIDINSKLYENLRIFAPGEETIKDLEYLKYKYNN